MQNLSIKATRLPVIASVLSDMVAKPLALGQRRQKFRVLKQGMMQEHFTGRTRLV